jgi:hypothetical protein
MYNETIAVALSWKSRSLVTISSLAKKSYLPLISGGVAPGAA